jgi:hypothetical protein
MKKLLGIALAVVTVAALGLIAIPAMASGPHDTTSVASETRTSVQARFQANNQVRATDENGYCYGCGLENYENCPCGEEDPPLDGTGAAYGYGYGNGYNYEDCPLAESGECPCGQEDRPLDGTGYGAINGYGKGECEGCGLDESETCPYGYEDRPLDGTGYGATNDFGRGNR